MRFDVVKAKRFIDLVEFSEHVLLDFVEVAVRVKLIPLVRQGSNKNVSELVRKSICLLDPVYPILTLLSIRVFSESCGIEKCLHVVCKVTHDYLPAPVD